MSRLPIFTLLAAVLLSAGCTTLKTPTFASDDGAIRGYDPVAYHVNGMPVRGTSVHSLKYNDATWFFASDENRRLFNAHPEKYAPAYGGYCAYAMSKGLVVSTDPQAWHIEGETLYLNYSLGVRKTWLKDVPGYISKADKHWVEKIQGQQIK